MLGVFDATQHARPIARSLSIYHSDKDFGYALGIDPMSEGMRLGKSWMMERGHGKWKVLVMFVFLCEHGSLQQRSGDMRARGGDVSPSLEG